MTKTSFTLKWEPPENDGGTPITDYIIEMKETMKKAWQRVSMIHIVCVKALRQSFLYLRRFFRLQVQKGKSLMLLYPI